MTVDKIIDKITSEGAIQPNGRRGERILEQFVRALVVLSFTAGIVYGFVVSAVIPTDSFLVIASVVFTWWFDKSRAEAQARTDQARADDRVAETEARANRGNT